MKTERTNWTSSRGGRFLWAALLGLLLAGGCAGKNKESRPSTVRESTVTRLQEARSALEAAPEDPKRHYQVGNALFDLGIYGEAVQAYQEALQRDPEFADAYANMGLALRRMGQYDAAAAAYAEALARRPDDITVWQNELALAQVMQDDARVLRALQRLSELQPKVVGLQAEYAQLLYRMGLYPEAVGAYEGVVHLAPESAEYWYALGLARYDAGQWPGAREAWEKVVALDPEDESARKGLAVVYWTVKDYDRAWQAVEECRGRGIALDPAFIEHLEADSGRSGPGNTP